MAFTGLAARILEAERKRLLRARPELRRCTCLDIISTQVDGHERACPLYVRPAKDYTHG